MFSYILSYFELALTELTFNLVMSMTLECVIFFLLCKHKMFVLLLDVFSSVQEQLFDEEAAELLDTISSKSNCEQNIY